jgi:sterol desaturase/sphingolipid hydroxylase (fatty acid hydroxylase superfamily)
LGGVGGHIGAPHVDTSLGYETRFGRGFISGVFAVALGALGFGGVLCLRFPSLLTTPDARALYPLEIVRFLIHLHLVGAFGLGVLSIVLSRRAPLGLSGIALVVAATLLGGSQAPIGTLGGEHALGLDWFLLNILVLAMLFVPLERLFARLPTQPIFRAGWLTDLLHFGVSHLLVQVTVLLTLVPAALFFRWAVHPGIQHAIASQPVVLQFIEIVIVADLSEYVVHRLFHTVPMLWRFHAVHHSSEAMDWLAASRIHLVDAVITRALAFVPLYVLGFATGPVYAYLVFVSFHAIFVHANVRFRFGALEQVIGTPKFHHWHHATRPVDRNFAIHLPAIDRLFGTLHMPEEFPAAYGIEGQPVPRRYLAQWVWPFAGSR